MSYSQTISQTFTESNARYVASKVAADLRQLQNFYSQPTDQQINDYVEELVAMLPGGYISEVKYGFTLNGNWILALRYTAAYGGGLSDANSGRVPVGVDIAGSTFNSFLTWTNGWTSLPSDTREKLLNKVSFRREVGDDPKADGNWSCDKSYSVNGTGLNRGLYVSNG
jgi:hypothetical protein